MNDKYEFFNMMLSKSKERLIKELRTKKGREKHGRCLIEGQKVIESIPQDMLDFTFTREDSTCFDSLLTTETPQDIAGIAHIPRWNIDEIRSRDVIVVFDGIQDPGNGGSIFRLAQAFRASLLLIDAVDPMNPKCIRSSAGAVFHVPNKRIARKDAKSILADLKRPVYRLERRNDACFLDKKGIASLSKKCIFIFGAEGSGITLDIKGTSLTIPHNRLLESLNVGHAVAITLFAHSLSSL